MEKQTVDQLIESYIKKIYGFAFQNKDEFAKYAMDQAIQSAKRYPEHMKNFQIYRFFHDYISSMEALMVLDELYDTGVFRPLTEEERVTSQLLVFSDRMPIDE